MMLFNRDKVAQFFSKNEGEKGAAAVEFAIAGSLVVVSVIALIEILTILLLSVLIEGGIREAARFGITGNEGATNRQQVILDIIGRNTLGLVNMETVEISTLVYDSFEDIGQEEDFIDAAPFNGTYDEGESFTDSNGNTVWDTDKGTPGLGSENDIVLYIVEYDWPFMTGIINSAAGREVRLKSAIPVKNEPYVIQEEEL